MLLLALVLIFFAIGLLMPEVHYGHEITVNKSAKEAWAVSQDLSKYPQWLDGFVSETLISGERGKAGSKYKVIVNPGEGQDIFEMIETVDEIKENEYVKLHFESDPMNFEQKYSFSETDGKATMKSDATVKGKGIMMRSMFAIMEMLGGSFSKQEAKNLNNLKKVIEENTTDYFVVDSLGQ